MILAAASALRAHQQNEELKKSRGRGAPQGRQSRRADEYEVIRPPKPFGQMTFDEYKQWLIETGQGSFI